jgi:hypothetical protein
MAKKKSKQALATSDKRNLGLRASPETQQRLKDLAGAWNTSVQSLFDELFATLLSKDAPSSAVIGSSSPMGSAAWAVLFLRSLPGAAVIKSKDLKVLWVNDGYAHMSHDSRENLIGKKVDQIWATQESATLIQQNDDEVIRTKQATVQVEEVRDLWGQKLKRLRIRFPIFSPSGEVEYLGAIGFDYSTIKNLMPPADAPEPSGGTASS